MLFSSYSCVCRTLCVDTGQMPNTPPRFADIQYSATLDENKPIGMFVDYII